MADSTTWLQRPGLAHQAVFDLCATEVSCLDGQKALLVSDPFYARELARRLAGEIIIRPAAGWGLSETDVRTILGPEIEWSRVSYCPETVGLPSSSVGAVIWAAPQKGTWPGTLELTKRLLDRHGSLFILGETGWLRRFVPGRTQSGEAGVALTPFASAKTVSRGLKRAGWRIERSVGFQGPASLLWGAASRAPAALGRDDLVDRCFAASRQYFVVNGRQAQWSPIWMVTAHLSQHVHELG